MCKLGMARINCTAIAQFARYRRSTELKASMLSAATDSAPKRWGRDITALGMTRLPGARPSELRAVQRTRPDHTASTLTPFSGASLRAVCALSRSACEDYLPSEIERIPRHDRARRISSA